MYIIIADVHIRGLKDMRYRVFKMYHINMNMDTTACCWKPCGGCTQVDRWQSSQDRFCKPPCNTLWSYSGVMIHTWPLLSLEIRNINTPIAFDERVTFWLHPPSHCLVHVRLLHFMRVRLRNGYTRTYAQIMQRTHTHKAVTGRVETKK